MIERLEWVERRLAALEQANAMAESVAAQALAAPWQLGGPLGGGIGGALRFRWAKTTGSIGAGSGNPPPGSTLAWGTGPITFYDHDTGDLSAEEGEARNVGGLIASGRVVGLIGKDGGPWDVIVDLC